MSVALDDFIILAGGENLMHFDEREWDKIGDFLLKNQEKFIKLYETLRGDL